MSSRLSLLLFLFLITLPLSINAIKTHQRSIFKTFPGLLSPHSPPSSVVFPLSGNIFPLGYYSVSLQIGNPPKSYDFDIDTGSDLTWVQCNAPCSGCTLPLSVQYKPKSNTVPCSDQMCSALHLPNKPHCPTPKAQCDYEVEYADQGSSMGALITDQFPLTFLNGSALKPRLAFGCGYDQTSPSTHFQPATARVLGLGRGRISLLTQLVSAGLTKNVVGHSLSSKGGGGFLFFGDKPTPSTGVSWTPLMSPDNHYSTGPAELLFNGKPTGLKGLKLIFDSGSSYTYFNSKTYQTILKLIENDLKGKPLTIAKDDTTLPICWKGAKTLKSVLEVNNLFKTLTINFMNGRKNTPLQIPPQSYLIISKTGNVCLGILRLRMVTAYTACVQSGQSGQSGLKAGKVGKVGKAGKAGKVGKQKMLNGDL